MTYEHTTGFITDCAVKNERNTIIFTDSAVKYGYAISFPIDGRAEFEHSMKCSADCTVMLEHPMKCAVTFDLDMKFVTDCTKKHCCYMPFSAAFGVMNVLAARGFDVRCTFAACCLTSGPTLLSMG